MTKEELKQEAEEWIKDHSGLVGSYMFVKYDYDSMQKAYLAGAEPREKQIQRAYELGKTELEKEINKLKATNNTLFNATQKVGKRNNELLADKGKLIDENRQAEEIIKNLCDGYSSADISENEMIKRIAKAEAFINKGNS